MAAPAHEEAQGLQVPALARGQRGGLRGAVRDRPLHLGPRGGDLLVEVERHREGRAAQREVGVGGHRGFEQGDRLWVFAMMPER